MKWTAKPRDGVITINTECFYCGVGFSFTKSEYLEAKFSKGIFTYKCEKCSSVAAYERERNNLMWCSPLHRGVIENKELKDE